jgi:hypothetical protein
VSAVTRTTKEFSSLGTIFNFWPIAVFVQTFTGDQFDRYSSTVARVQFVYHEQSSCGIHSSVVGPTGSEWIQNNAISSSTGRSYVIVAHTALR